MITKMFQNWWLYAVRGLLAITFGVLAFIWPEKTLTVIVMLFGAFALVDGIFTMSIGFTSRPFNDRWWALLLEGLAGTLLGWITFIWPNISGQVLLYFIAAWAIVTGIFSIVAVVHFWKFVREWLLLVSGILSIIAGVLLFAFPNAGAVALVWVVALYSIIHGIFLIVDAFRMRDLMHEFESADKMISDATQVLSWWMRF